MGNQLIALQQRQKEGTNEQNLREPKTSSLEVDVKKTTNRDLAPLLQAKGCHGAIGQNELAQGPVNGSLHLELPRGNGIWKNETRTKCKTE